MRRRPFFTEIRTEVSRVFAVSEDDLTGHRRHYVYSFPRSAVVWLAREMTGASFPQIGRMLGGRDHSTVIHAHKRCLGLLRSDPVYRAKVRRVRERLIERTRTQYSIPVQVKPEPVPEPEVKSLPWWERSDDELIGEAIAAHRANGGDFIEVGR